MVWPLPSQRREPSEQSGVISPHRLSRIASRCGGRLAQSQSVLFHAHGDFRVPVRRLETHVSDPSTNHVHLDARSRRCTAVVCLKTCGVMRR
jgi:hypothetical protein